jgi:hypothetical protein
MSLVLSATRISTDGEAISARRSVTRRSRGVTAVRTSHTLLLYALPSAVEYKGASSATAGVPTRHQAWTAAASVHGKLYRYGTHDCCCETSRRRHRAGTWLQVIDLKSTVEASPRATNGHRQADRREPTQHRPLAWLPSCSRQGSQRRRRSAYHGDAHTKFFVLFNLDAGTYGGSIQRTPQVRSALVTVLRRPAAAADSAQQPTSWPVCGHP